MEVACRLHGGVKRAVPSGRGGLGLRRGRAAPPQPLRRGRRRQGSWTVAALELDMLRLAPH